MEGHTADSAVHIVCTKSPELYSASKAENPTLEEKGGPPQPASAGTAKPGIDRKRGADRDPNDRAAALERQLANKEKQIENLKRQQSGKGGKGAQWGGKGGSWYGPSPQWGGKGNQWGGAPSGSNPGRTPCPPDICQAFNFTAAGCNMGSNCKYKHVCCKCGGQHAFRQCPN